MMINEFTGSAPGAGMLFEFRIKLQLLLHVPIRMAVYGCKDWIVSIFLKKLSVGNYQVFG
jgi:hypothetical protein